MVHRLRNWRLALDLSRTMPDLMKEIFRTAFEMAHLPPPDSLAVSDLVEKCAWAESQDGLEVCITMHREDLFPPWRGREEELPEFEEFLKSLDTLLEDIKTTVATKHRLHALPEIKKFPF